MSKFVLPVTTHIPTNSYFALSLPLAVILSHQETREWYLENFINIYMENHNNICFTDIGFGILCRYTSVFDYSISKYYVNGCIPKNMHYIQHNMPHITFI